MYNRIAEYNPSLSKYKTIDFDDVTNGNRIERNPKWWYIADDPYRILLVGSSGWGKTNAMLNLINDRSYIDKIYLYAKNPCEAKYKISIKRREKIGLQSCDGPNALI